MTVPRIAGFLCAFLTFICAVKAAQATLDLLPAVGDPAVHLRISQTSAEADGPRLTTSDIVLRRTGPAAASVQFGGQTAPLRIDADGSLQPDPAGAGDADITDLVAALNIAHAVTSGSGAGDLAGWTAAIPIPTHPVPPGGPPASPAPPLMLPVRIVASNANGDLDIDGSVETSVAAPGTPRRAQHSRGGGGFGGFGGYGGFGGRGGSRGGDDGPAGGGSPPITLDIHVTGRITRNALTRMTIAQTRRIELGGLTYSNAANCTIDVNH